jgi:hypothetical protein
VLACIVGLAVAVGSGGGLLCQQPRGTAGRVLCVLLSEQRRGCYLGLSAAGMTLSWWCLVTSGLLLGLDKFTRPRVMDPLAAYDDILI